MHGDIEHPENPLQPDHRQKALRSNRKGRGRHACAGDARTEAGHLAVAAVIGDAVASSRNGQPLDGGVSQVGHFTHVRHMSDP